MKYPLVSVIIPCYNYQEYVSDCILSCLEQKYPGKIEVIVIDDFSSDGSSAYIRRNFTSALGTKQLKIIQFRKNQGYSKAKNEGIIKSFGQFIVTIDADDMLTRDSIALRAQYLLKNPSCILVHAHAYTIDGVGGFEYWNKRERKLQHKLEQTKRWRNLKTKIHAQSVMVRRDVYIKYGLYDENLRSKSDNEYWERLRTAGQSKNMHRIEHAVAFYRKHDKSMIEYRRKNPSYSQEVQRKCDTAKIMRKKCGITWGNTRFLRS